MGSVKDVEILRKPQDLHCGEGFFVFSDRFSVFDWGVMPDLINGKGKSLCIIGAWFFEKLQNLGFGTHYIGVQDEYDGKVKKLPDVKSPPFKMKVKFLRVMKPEIKNGRYDYSSFRREKGNFVVPLEVIYRNFLPSGSSVFRRLKEGKISPSDLGLQTFPKENTKLPKPFVDFSTKFESQDRYIDEKEAKEISGLDDREFEKLKEMTLAVNEIITKEVSKLNILNEDGKFEFGLDEKRNLIFVDVLGTPDECRFSYEGIQLSKEVLRSYYRKTPWYEKVQEAKKKEPIRWRELISDPPPKLDEKLKKLVSEMYMSFCNAITERKWFDVRDFRNVIRELREVVSEFQ